MPSVMRKDGKTPRVDYQARAPRFTIQMPVHYCVGDEPNWHEGTAVNISRTGILFQPVGDLGLDTMLKMRFVLPAEVSGETAASVTCWGPVVRRGSVTPADSHPAVAATILRYSFHHE